MGYNIWADFNTIQDGDLISTLTKFIRGGLPLGVSVTVGDDEGNTCTGTPFWLGGNGLIWIQLDMTSWRPGVVSIEFEG